MGGNDLFRKQIACGYIPKGGPLKAVPSNRPIRKRNPRDTEATVPGKLIEHQPGSFKKSCKTSVFLL
ncbi:hypothetical protein EYF80_043727 [Liparis tanakae]|uniref:Uncharacterized protein n=1 Tax=Liparis tanakae TaxID=230148 RepID=A0A4Z2FZG1_9TELE|nr:hypothetical protein EYF80_043727 [Liparis tanakae]